MLNDFFISRDVLGFLQNYLAQQQLMLPELQQKLADYGQRQYMSYEQWWRLLDELATLHPVPALGLAIGRTVQVQHCGVIGYLFRTSRTLHDALHCFQRFQRLIYAGSQAHIELSSNKLRTADTISLVWNPDQGYSSQLSDELLLAAMINVIREIVQQADFQPVQVDFTHRVSDQSLALYQAFFDCAVNHDQPKLALSFHLRDLDLVIPHEDQTLHSILGEQAEQLLTRLPEQDVFLVELRDVIMRCLHEGRPDAKTVAAQLNLSIRTLHRRLKEKNRVFKDVLKDIRKSMALRYLGDAKLTLAEISLLLGYQEQSAFTRAFTDWCDLPPGQYQRIHLNPSNHRIRG